MRLSVEWSEAQQQQQQRLTALAERFNVPAEALAAAALSDLLDRREAAIEAAARRRFATSVLGFSLILNHPFVDGNKRIGHAAFEVFLVLNGLELRSHIDEAESMILAEAAGTVARQ